MVLKEIISRSEQKIWFENSSPISTGALLQQGLLHGNHVSQSHMYALSGVLILCSHTYFVQIFLKQCGVTTRQLSTNQKTSFSWLFFIFVSKINGQCKST